MIVSLLDSKVLRYVYIDHNQQVHLLIPLGAKHPLASFFGLSEDKKNQSSQSLSAMTELTACIEKLKQSLWASAENLDRVGTFRHLLEQCEIYQSTLQALLDDHVLMESIRSSAYPDAFIRLFRKRTNAGLILVSDTPHPQLPPMGQLFGLDSGDVNNHFLPTLLNQFSQNSRLISEKSYRQQLITQYSHGVSATDLPGYQAHLTACFLHDHQRSLDFTIDHLGRPIDEALVRQTLQINREPTPREYIQCLLDISRVRDIFNGIECSPFYHAISTDATECAKRYSRITQYFLAILNSFCVAARLTNINFAKILGSDQALSESLADYILQAITLNRSVEQEIADFINYHAAQFGLSAPIPKRLFETAGQDFISRYREIEALPTFDRDLLLDPTRRGDFCLYRNNPCVDFSLFLENAGRLLSQSNRDYYERIRASVSQLPTILQNKQVYYQPEVPSDYILQYLLPVITRRETRNYSIAARWLFTPVADGVVLSRLMPAQRQQLTQLPQWRDFARFLVGSPVWGSFAAEHQVLLQLPPCSFEKRESYHLRQLQAVNMFRLVKQRATVDADSPGTSLLDKVRCALDALEISYDTVSAHAQDGFLLTLPQSHLKKIEAFNQQSMPAPLTQGALVWPRTSLTPFTASDPRLLAKEKALPAPQSAVAAVVSATTAEPAPVLVSQVGFFEVAKSPVVAEEVVRADDMTCLRESLLHISQASSPGSTYYEKRPEIEVSLTWRSGSWPRGVWTRQTEKPYCSVGRSAADSLFVMCLDNYRVVLNVDGTELAYFDCSQVPFRKIETAEEQNNITLKYLDYYLFLVISGLGSDVISDDPHLKIVRADKDWLVKGDGYDCVLSSTGHRVILEPDSLRTEADFETTRAKIRTLIQMLNTTPFTKADELSMGAFPRS